MALYDLYAEYRNQRLSPEEQSMLEEALPQSRSMAASEELRDVRVPGGYQTQDGFVPDPVVATHIGIAMDRAQAQFAGYPPMPEDPDVAVRFPGVDPVGKYSVIDMKFAQRQAALDAVLQTRPPEVQSYVRSLQQAMKRQPEFMQVSEAMTHAAQRHRTLTRASKLCLDKDGRRLLHRQARSMEADLPVEQYDKLLQGMEYAAGVKEGPLPRDVADFYATHLHAPIPQAVLDQAGEYQYRPQALEVEFQDFDNKALHSQFSNPRNWGKGPEELSRDVIDLDSACSMIPPYAVATADRVLSPAFQAGENSGLSRSDLLLVDGMTVREKMEMEGLTDPTPQQMRERSATYVAAALMAGRRVEAYVPDRNGRIPAQPTQITKTGYQPSPMKKVTLNAWERHFSRYGFFKEKAAKAEEYQRCMAARARIERRFGDHMAQPLSPEYHQRQAAQLAAREAGADRFVQIQQALTKISDSRGRLREALFPQPQTPPLVHNENFRSDRTAHVNFCVGRLAEKGCALEDIFDPTKLAAEKAAAAQEYRDHAQADDVAWYARHMVSGTRAIQSQLDAIGRRTDFLHEASLLRSLPVLEMGARAQFDLNQEMDRTGCRAALEEAIGTDALRAHQQRCGNYGSTFSNILNGYTGEMTLYREAPRLAGEQAPELGIYMANALCGQIVREDMARRLTADPGAGLGGQSFVEFGAIPMQLSQSKQFLRLTKGINTPERGAQVAGAAMAGQLGAKIPIRYTPAQQENALGRLEVLAPPAPAKAPEKSAPKAPQLGGGPRAK